MSRRFFAAAIMPCIILTGFSRVGAASDVYECEVLQVSVVDEKGRQVTAPSFEQRYLLGTRFMVDSRTGVLTGKNISTSSYENKVLADGRTHKNPLTVISSYKGKAADGVNATFFLTVNTHVSGSEKTFFLKGMNGELISGTCK